MNKNQTLFETGYFFTGCNYWASHAGTNMWSDWRPDVVENDLARLSDANIKVMRMFPLWSDFQPLRMHRGGGGSEHEIRLREEPLTFTEAGRAGVDEIMADRFGEFCDLAEKYGIKLIVGLITGWMSGRMFMPEAFAGRGLITDPLVVRWQIRFVRFMVRRFKSHPAIAAWDLGNECNCMQGGISRDAAYCWAAQITNAIRDEDKSHPVVSGMHSLSPTGTWSPEDQGEALDILCTHPYPIFTPHCDTDPINEMKTILHSTAESVMYASLGGKPCFIEEAGSLGPMIADDEIAADYVRAAMFSAWAHNLRGFIWWCANEQSALAHTPYDWSAVERELGLFRIDGSKKPVLTEMSRFTGFADDFAHEYGTLPTKILDAVCILTEGQDIWAAAYGSFILAKQAGLDIEFAWCNDEIPIADAYLLPALTGSISIMRHTLNLLLERVREGAALYLSLNDALLSPFSEFTGVRVKTRSRRINADTVGFDDTEFHMWSQFKYVFESIGADVIASSDDGNPAFTEYKYGNGRVCFCAYPIELDAAVKPGVVSGAAAIPYYLFYKHLNFRSADKKASTDCPYIGLTEHIISENEHFLTLLNHTPEEHDAIVSLDGYKLKRMIKCDVGYVAFDSGFKVTLPANTGAVALITRLE